VPTRGHHVVPRCKGGRDIAPTCHSCEDFIHKTWTHNELRDTFNTVEQIQALPFSLAPVASYSPSAMTELRDVPSIFPSTDETM
jgi:hypothetical protein